MQTRACIILMRSLVALTEFVASQNLPLIEVTFHSLNIRLVWSPSVEKYTCNIKRKIDLRRSSNNTGYNSGLGLRLLSDHCQSSDKLII